MLLLDPASGSGNFLTETYIALRRLENVVMKELFGAEIVLGEISNPIEVSIGQFYGIEINDFAVTVAKTALWIAEAQMMQETENIVHMNLDFLPLKSYANIVEGNALALDWNEVVPREKVNYIMGNPPFVANTVRVSGKDAHSAAMLDESQKKERLALFGKSGGVLDYVACWYKKAAEYMASLIEAQQSTGLLRASRSATKGVLQTHETTPPTDFASERRAIRAAFVSTNSITQGQQVAPLWKPLFESGVKINFAHQTFKWNAETTDMATVFVVIIGFSYVADKEACLFSGENKKIVPHINAYLMNADDIFVEKRSKPLADVPVMQNGGKSSDGNHLILTSKEREELLASEPTAQKFLRPYTMGADFIHRTTRYCLWLVGAEPSDIRKCPSIAKRVAAVRDFRLKSTKAATRKKADTPSLFDEVRSCDTNYVAIPKVSSGGRKYIPMDYLPPEIIPGDMLFMVQGASLYHFGILTSNVHMAWQNVVCSKYGPSYRYSNTLAYNNFPWPSPTDSQKAKIEQTAQMILDARNLYPKSTFADLYDEAAMPPELRKAHQANDRAVMAVYNFPVKMSEAECVARLMEMYLNLRKNKKRGTQCPATALTIWEKDDIISSKKRCSPVNG